MINLRAKPSPSSDDAEDENAVASNILVEPIPPPTSTTIPPGGKECQSKPEIQQMQVHISRIFLTYRWKNLPLKIAPGASHPSVPDMALPNLSRRNLFGFESICMSSLFLTFFEACPLPSQIHPRSASRGDCFCFPKSLRTPRTDGRADPGPVSTLSDGRHILGENGIDTSGVPIISIGVSMFLVDFSLKPSEETGLGFDRVKREAKGCACWIRAGSCLF